MPSSAMASTAAGLTLSAGWEPAERTSIRALAEGGEEGGGHLGAAGVVDADEQDGGLVAHERTFSVGQLERVV